MKILPNTIITLHEIKDSKWLNNVIISLKNHYHLVSAKEFENYYYNNTDLKNACHLTFDDGDLSFYNNVLPLIKKHKIPVSTYVSPMMAKERRNFWFQEIRGYNQEKLFEIAQKIINDKNRNIQPAAIKPFLKTLRIETILEIIKLYQKETNTLPKPPMNMTDKQLIEIKSTGLVEIGAHTLNHPILINESDESATYEIEKSIDQLSEILNCDTKYFVYPNGDYGEREINILKKKGIKLAFSIKRGKISQLNNTYCIPRSGSPFISPSIHNRSPYIYSKCILMFILGEEKYYHYATSKGWLTSFKNNIQLKTHE